MRTRLQDRVKLGVRQLGIDVRGQARWPAPAALPRRSFLRFLVFRVGVRLVGLGPLAARDALHGVCLVGNRIDRLAQHAASPRPRSTVFWTSSCPASAAGFVVASLLSLSLFLLDMVCVLSSVMYGRRCSVQVSSRRRRSLCRLPGPAFLKRGDPTAAAAAASVSGVGRPAFTPDTV